MSREVIKNKMIADIQRIKTKLNHRRPLRLTKLLCRRFINQPIPKSLPLDIQEMILVEKHKRCLTRDDDHHVWRIYPRRYDKGSSRGAPTKVCYPDPRSKENQRINQNYTFLLSKSLIKSSFRGHPSFYTSVDGKYHKIVAVTSPKNGRLYFTGSSHYYSKDYDYKRNPYIDQPPELVWNRRHSRLLPYKFRHNPHITL